MKINVSPQVFHCSFRRRKVSPQRMGKLKPRNTKRIFHRPSGFLSLPTSSDVMMFCFQIKPDSIKKESRIEMAKKMQRKKGIGKRKKFSLFPLCFSLLAVTFGITFVV